jgi:hypothetical protein
MRVSKYLAVELHRAFLGEIRNEILEHGFGSVPAAEPRMVEVKLQESQGLMDKIYQSYSSLLYGLGGRPSLASIPADRLASIKDQLENLKEQLRVVLTFRGRPSANSDRP